MQSDVNGCSWRQAGRSESLMALHNEIEFENDICEHLAANGWLYAEKDAADYDRQLALFPSDVGGVDVSGMTSGPTAIVAA
jgi:hypothetical protein